MKFLFSVFLMIFIIGCATTPVLETVQSDCNRMLWRSDLEKSVEMFCLGVKIWNEEHTEYSHLIAEAYHPEDKGILFTIWDDDGDCVGDVTVIYNGEKLDDDRYLYKFVNYIPAFNGLLAIRNTEEKFGVKVLRKAECSKKE